MKEAESDWMHLYQLPQQTRAEARHNVSVFAYGKLRLGMPMYLSMMENTEYKDTFVLREGFRLEADDSSVMATYSDRRTKVVADKFIVPYWKYEELVNLESRGGFVPYPIQEGVIFVKDKAHFLDSPREIIGQDYVSWLKKQEQKVIFDHLGKQLIDIIRDIHNIETFPYEQGRKTRKA